MIDADNEPSAYLQTDNPPEAVQLKTASAFKDGISVQLWNRDKDPFIDYRGRVCPAEIFQRSAAATGPRQTESQVSQVTDFRNRQCDLHRIALVRAALFRSGIKRGLERHVIIEAIFFRIVDATRNSQGHKGEWIFYHIFREISNCEILGVSKTLKHGRTEAAEETCLGN
jgi:hypothetical protein